MATVDILQAIMWAAEAWKSVSPSTITKCCKKAGFLPNSQDEENREEEREEGANGAAGRCRASGAYTGQGLGRGGKGRGDWRGVDWGGVGLGIGVAL